jgi:hypothetical protein
MMVYEIAAELPPIDQLRERCQALAVLERIVDSRYPYYAYTLAWGDGEAALMSNGSGDEWTIVFTAEGAFIRVFAHESDMSPYRDSDLQLWPGLLDGIPAVFRRQLEEPAFGDEGRFIATAVLWRLADDDRWHAGQGITFPALRGPYDTGPDGTGMLQILLEDITDRYVEFAREYYEIEIERTAVEPLVARQPLTDTLVQALNPDLTVAEIRDDIDSIGYPVAVVGS